MIFHYKSPSDRSTVITVRSSPTGGALQGPRFKAGGTSQFPKPDSVTDPRSHLENGFLLVAMEPLGEGDSPASPGGSSQHVKGLAFYFTFRHHEYVGSHTHSYGQEAAAGVT